MYAYVSRSLAEYHVSDGVEADEADATRGPGRAGAAETRQGDGEERKEKGERRAESRRTESHTCIR